MRRFCAIFGWVARRLKTPTLRLDTRPRRKTTSNKARMNTLLLVFVVRFRICRGVRFRFWFRVRVRARVRVRVRVRVRIRVGVRVRVRVKLGLRLGLSWG
jgi:hypothetical protein